MRPLPLQQPRRVGKENEFLKSPPNPPVLQTAGQIGARTSLIASAQSPGPVSTGKRPLALSGYRCAAHAAASRHNPGASRKEAYKFQRVPASSGKMLTKIDSLHVFASRSRTENALL